MRRVLLFTVISVASANLLLSSEEFADENLNPEDGENADIMAAQKTIINKLNSQWKTLDILSKKLDQLFGSQGQQSLSGIFKIQKNLVKKINQLETKLDNIQMIDMNGSSSAYAFGSGLVDTADTEEWFEGPCPLKWLHWAAGKRCYLLEKENLPWAQARKRCAQKGGHLAAVESDNEMRYLIKVGKSKCHMGTYWLGGKEVDCQWYWDMGPTQPDKLIHYKSWLPKEPNNIGMGEDHITLKLTKDGKAGWNDLNMSVSQRFICERAAKENSYDGY